MAARAVLLPSSLPPAFTLPGPFWVGFCKPSVFPHRTRPVRTKQSYLLFPGVLGPQEPQEELHPFSELTWGTSNPRSEGLSSSKSLPQFGIPKPIPVWMELGRGEGVKTPDCPFLFRGCLSRWGCPDKQKECGGLPLIPRGLACRARQAWLGPTAKEAGCRVGSEMERVAGPGQGLESGQTGVVSGGLWKCTFRTESWNKLI